MNERIADLLQAMREQLRVASQAQADAERAERFTRTTALISLAVAVASLGAAVAAIIVGV